ncbi:MAG: hypothetical protein Q4G25_12935, partial [Paracoccus sp. (in: a-proteobacteria)]|nr:hypothetical protein [Paracoccus sp. (in: a-proteobacteria)]
MEAQNVPVDLMPETHWAEVDQGEFSAAWVTCRSVRHWPRRGGFWRCRSGANTAPYVVKPKTPSGSVEAAQRLFAAVQPIAGTLAETYLRSRGITRITGLDALRSHPRCYYRANGVTEIWPAMIAAVTDNDGKITGVQRTWLAGDGSGNPIHQMPGLNT